MTSIKQIKDVRQRPEEGFRVWYANEYFDLIFWYEEEGGFLKGFQFCYGKPHTEKAYTWELNTTSHHYVKENRAQGTGILRGNAGTINPKVLAQFRMVRGEVPENLADFVLSKLQDTSKEMTG